MCQTVVCLTLGKIHNKSNKEYYVKNLYNAGCTWVIKIIKQYKIKQLEPELKLNELNKIINPYIMTECHDIRDITEIVS
jgi:hypothetical protein